MMTSYDDAMRTIIELPGAQLEALGRFCGREGISRAEAVRRAVADLLERDQRQQPARAFGLWKKRPVDAVAHQRRLRREWA
ncbi:MAG: CopG family transcriptional regulator [Vicinamibacterales bacterium]|nr:CopG family transcriptional regulator [Vicinamibacterales bacterium]